MLYENSTNLQVIIIYYVIIKVVLDKKTLNCGVARLPI